jgi:hypothetical protein
MEPEEVLESGSKLLEGSKLGNKIPNPFKCIFTAELYYLGQRPLVKLIFCLYSKCVVVLTEISKVGPINMLYRTCFKMKQFNGISPIITLMAWSLQCCSKERAMCFSTFSSPMGSPK